MPKIAVADSTCLIGLSKIDKLEILRDLFGAILIPPSVFHEVVVLGSGRPGAAEIDAAEWIQPRDVTDRLAVNALRLSLGAGESEAIVLASEQAADFSILDDWQARQVALGLSLPVIGTVAVLAKAEEKGLIGDLASAVEALRKSGFYFL
jgi:predicted nucleic acid-binding protein